VRVPLPEFRLETYFSRWEFAAEHHLTASDAQTLTVGEVLALGTEEDRAAFAELPLGYLETWGTDRLREAVAGTYTLCGPGDVLVFAGAEEALFWLLQLLVAPGEHAVVTAPSYQALETVPVAAGVQVSGVLLDEADGWRLAAGRGARRPAPVDSAARGELPEQPDRRRARRGDLGCTGRAVRRTGHPAGCRRGVPRARA